MTFGEAVLQEFCKLVAGGIDRLKDELAGGASASHEEYRYRCGQIEGLRTALNFIEDAQLNVEKKMKGE